MAVHRERNRNRNRWYIISCLYLHLVCSTVSGEAKTSPSSSSPHCPNCLHKQDNTDRLRLEAIKSQILSKLGLRHKPNITHSLPKEIVLETLFRAEDHFFTTTSSERTPPPSSSQHSSTSTSSPTDYDDFYGRTKEIISFAEQGSKLNENRVLEFRVSPESGQGGAEFRVKSASFWLKADFRRRRSQKNKCRTEIYVFKIISSRLPESVTLSNSQFDRLTADPISIKLEESESGWQKLDVTETVRSWLTESYNDKLRLFVDCSCCSNWHIHLFNNELDKKSNPNRPFLVIHTDPNTAKRVRRRALECSPESGNQCCKERFYVSFKALGWDDWVIAPQGYFANYCRGDCGQHRTPDTYKTYHTHVLEEARKTQPLSGMQACCAPLKFSSVSLIYYGPNFDVIKRDLPKMVVDECGCP